MSSSPNFPQALFLVFLTLKLTNHIDWSWWFIFMPIIVNIIGVGIYNIIMDK